MEDAAYPTLWGQAAPTLGVFARDQPIRPEEARAPRGGPPAPRRSLGHEVSALGPGSGRAYLGSDVTPPSHTNWYKRLSQPASSFVKRRKRIKLLQASASETSCLLALPGDHGLQAGGAHEAGPDPQHGLARPGGPGEWLLDAGRAPGGRVLRPHSVSVATVLPKPAALPPWVPCRPFPHRTPRHPGHLLGVA